MATLINKNKEIDARRVLDVEHQFEAMVGARKRRYNDTPAQKQRTEFVEDYYLLYTRNKKKLAEFEDFMEANKFENIEDLQNALNGEFEHIFDEKHKIWIKTIEDKTYVEKRNRMLEERWQKLREWVERKYADDYIDANDTKSPLTAQEYYGGSADSCRKTLDKMQELEIKE